MDIRQNDTKEGLITILATDNLTDKEGFLVKIENATPVPGQAALPDDNADFCLFVVSAGGAAGAYVDLQPLSPNRNVRVKTSGIIAAGEEVLLQAPGGTVITRTGAAADTYFSPGIAEEDCASGGFVKIRPFPHIVVVP